jgi:hypothetical protein
MGLEFHFESCSLLNSWVIGRIVDTLIWVFNCGKFLVHSLSLGGIDLGCKCGAVLMAKLWVFLENWLQIGCL